MNKPTPSYREAIASCMACSDEAGAKALAIDASNNLSQLAGLPTYSQLVVALRKMLEHEGEREANGIGIESDSEALTSAKRSVTDILGRIPI
ncbi:MAG: hypothetical protein O9327_02160 [Polaromonas sp.]|jgi:hypothetical protein|nr:hypothetical protein [Polaromonas sp.]